MIREIHWNIEKNKEFRESIVSEWEKFNQSFFVAYELILSAPISCYNWRLIKVPWEKESINVFSSDKYVQ